VLNRVYHRFELDRNLSGITSLKESLDFRVFALQQLIPANHLQGFDTDSGKEMAQLTSDVTATDNRDRSRHLFQSEHIVAGPIGSFKVGALWPTSGRENHSICRNFGAVDRQRVVTGQNSGSAKQCHILAEGVL
jgi:hypothetical protein